MKTTWLLVDAAVNIGFPVTLIGHHVPAESKKGDASDGDDGSAGDDGSVYNISDGFFTLFSVSETLTDSGDGSVLNISGSSQVPIL